MWDKFYRNQMDQYMNRMDQFSPYGNNDPLLSDLSPMGMGMGPNETEMDTHAYLSGDNFTFLQQKLSEATALNASYSQRESHMKSTIEDLKKEKHNIAQKCEALLLDQQNSKSNHVLLQQKADAETRQRFLYQDKVNGLERNLEDEMTQRKKLEDQVKEMQINLTSSDNFSKELYAIADEFTRQIGTLKEEIHVMQEMLTVYKSRFMKVNQENEVLHSDLEFVNSQLNELGHTFKEASSDIQLFKEENLKHETYINETLNRFKEITVHFESMKDQYLLQQEALDRLQNESLQKNKDISETKKELSCKVKEYEKLKKSSSIRENELKTTVTKLQDTLDGLVNLREQLEEKNKTNLTVIDDLREENIKLRAEVDSIKSILSVERNYIVEKKNCIEKAGVEKEEWKHRYEEAIGKLSLFEQRENEYKSQNEEYYKEIIGLKNEIKEMHETMRSIDDENKWYSVEKENLTEQLIAKGKEMENCLDDAGTIEESLKRRQSELMLMADKMSSMKEEIEKLDNETNELSNQLNISKKTEEESNKKIKDFEDRLIKCQFLFMDNDKKYSALLDKCESYEKLSKDDTKIINDLTEENRILNMTCHEGKHVNETLNYELNESKEQLENTLQEHGAMFQKNNDNIKTITLDIKQEVEQYRRYCDEKDEAISNLSAKLDDERKLLEMETMKLADANGVISSLKAKTEGMSDTINRVSEEKQEYIKIIENFTNKEESLRKEIEAKIIQVKDSEFSMSEQKRDFEQYQLNVDNIDKLWEAEWKRGLIDIQDELSRDHIIMQ